LLEPILKNNDLSRAARVVALNKIVRSDNAVTLRAIASLLSATAKQNFTFSFFRKIGGGEKRIKTQR